MSSGSGGNGGQVSAPEGPVPSGTGPAPGGIGSRGAPGEGDTGGGPVPSRGPSSPGERGPRKLVAVDAEVPLQRAGGGVRSDRMAAALVHREPGLRGPRRSALARRYN